MHYFSLNKNVYATQYEDAIIILDVERDNYLSLIDDAAKYFNLILSIPFEKSNETYIPAIKETPQNAESYNTWIAEFLEQGLIIPTKTASQKIVNPAAQVSGGLREYKWDTKKNWNPEKNASYVAIAKAWFTLMKVNRAIKKGGMKKLFTLVAQTKNIKKAIKPSQQDLENISAAVDAATKLSFQKTYCLGWATAFVIEARKRGIDCNLKIGIQTNPFYAHAWAEFENKVIHDDQQVAQVLATIATLPKECS
jgi:hypothetical protein